MRKLTLILLMFALPVVQLLAQSKTITGKVTDEKGNGIANASITVKGFNSGVTSGVDGTFSLNLPADAKFIIISSTGYVEQVAKIENQQLYNIVLKLAEIEPPIAIAYGMAKRSTFTGSASTIKSSDIQKLQTSNVTRALDGLVPGVQLSTNSGQPGSGVNIRIRGVGSINANASPLFVVDGVPYSNNVNSTDNTNNPLNFLNPSDIESISVLKDAASTSLYGSRAANGIVMITTKRGKGKTKFEIQTRYGVNTRGVPEYDVIRDPGQFLEVYWKSLKHGAMFRTTSPLSGTDAALFASQNMFSADRLNSYNPYAVPNGQYVIDPTTGKLNSNARLLYNDNWENEMLNNSIRQEYTATMSGSTEKTQYFMSLGYLDDKGIAIKTGFNRITTRLRLDQVVNNWVKTGINFSYGKSRIDNTLDASSGNNGSYANLFSFTRNIAPVYPIWTRNAQGNFVLDAKGERVYDFGDGKALSQGTRRYAAAENPRAVLDLDDYNTKTHNFIGRAYIELKPIKDFTFTFNYGTDYNSSRKTNFQNGFFGNGSAVNGRNLLTTNIIYTENINELINYKKEIDKHAIDILVGHESYSNSFQTSFGQKTQFMIPGSTELGGGATVEDAKSSEDRETLESYFTRAQYEYSNKYLISASLRRDGSSRFSPKNRWGNFWSLGLGYIISEEEFMKKADFINQLKLKASYGTNGNQDLLYAAGSANVDLSNYYPYTNQYVVNTTGSPNIILDYVGNSNISWENLGIFNIGIEFSMFDTRLNGSIEYYSRKNSNLLFPRPRATSTGVQSVPDNIGDVVNKGVDVDLNYQIVKKPDFTWSLGINFNHNRNKITKLPEENRARGIVVPNSNFKYLEGRSVYDYFIEQFAGVDPNTGLAMFYKDEIGVNGLSTGKKVVTIDVSQATRYYLDKSALPDLTGGINTQMAYKNFDLSVLTSFGIGGWIFDAPYRSLMYGGGTADIQTWHKDILNSWTPTNTNTNIPKVQEGYNAPENRSDRFLIGADYFSVRNITLGYAIPAKELEKYGLNSFRFYVVADNVYLFSKRKGLDPRQSFAGGSFNGYSPIRTLSFGINLGF